MKTFATLVVLVCRVAAIAVVGSTIYVAHDFFLRYEVEVKFRPRPHPIVVGPRWT